MKLLKLGLGASMIGLYGSLLYETISWNEQKQKEGELKNFSKTFLTFGLISFPLFVLRKKLVFSLT